jgi:DinB superfamily
MMANFKVYRIAAPSCQDNKPHRTTRYTGKRVPDPRYPIGEFEFAPLAPHDRPALIAQLAAAPRNLRAAVAGLSDAQLDTPYRPGGWTPRQLVHHLADGHINWYIRTKLALTEARPLIKPFSEADWADLPDARTGPLEPSLAIFENLHARWVLLFESLRPEDFARTFHHPERGELDLDYILASMAWHARHHTAHITEFRKRLL